MAKKLHFLLPLVLLLSLISTTVHSRSTPSSALISDGVNHLRSPNYLVLNPFAAESTCDPTYGFMPCTTTALGNLFLMIVYGYLMFMAATYLSTGSELLLEILGPGVIGGLFLPVLGALPDAMLILVSGLSGTKETAQSQVSVGMGLLAGSTVMLITVIWGSCVIVGKCDLEGSGAIDDQNTKVFSLTGTGVTTDIWTCYAARIMAVSIIPFIIVQLPQMLNSTSGRHLAVLIALIVSLSLLVSYCLYQIFQPWIQERRIAYAKYKHLITGILKYLRQHYLGRLLQDNGTLNTAFLEKLFTELDVDNSGNLSAVELKALMIGVEFDQIDFDKDDAGAKLLKDFDTDISGSVTYEEFVEGFKKWINRAKQARNLSADNGANPFNFLNNYHQEIKRERKLLGEEDQSDDVERIVNAKWISFKAVLLLLLGTIIAAAFADPLVDVVDNFSDATSIPSFFISFIALPLATNSSEAVSAIIFASRKKQKTTSLTFSELYGAVTMNNILCLSVFLALVYARGLTWDFSSEVLVILIVCIVMGALGSFRTTFPLWTCSVAFILYPFSLALVYVLDYVFGWS